MVTASAENQPDGSRSWLLALALAGFTFLAYQPVWHAGFIWDDDYNVANNMALRSFDGLRRIWFELGATPQYYPLTHTSFWMEYRLWGLSPLGYHLVNVGLHALNSILVWLVLRELGVKGAALAAAIFALHPVHVESVAWITERKNVLSGFFYLSALLAYLRSLPAGAAGSDFRTNLRSQSSDANPKPWRFYWLALALYVCALFSKSVTCSLPVAILLLVWWKRNSLGWRDVCALLPFLALGMAAGLTTVWAEKHVVGAEGTEWVLSLSERCFVAGRALWFYAGKLVWPWKLTFIYPRWQIDSMLWWQYLYPAGAMGVVVWLWAWRSRWGRGPLTAVLFFAVTLAPALGFFDVFPFRYSFVADHFQYLASLGLIAFAASGIVRILNHGRLWPATMGNAICSVLLATLAGLTWRQAHIYRDIEILWRDTVTKNPNAWMAHYNLGLALSQAGKFEEAAAQYKLGLRIEPDDAVARNNLGISLEQAGKSEEAIEQYELALQIKSDYADAHHNFGSSLLRSGRIEEAIRHWEQALRIKPDFAEAHNNLGVALVQLGRVPEAIKHWEQALQTKPDYAEAHHNLAGALMRLGRTQEAIEHWEQALQIKPDYAEAHNNLGSTLAQAGKFEEAVGHCEQAVAIKPDYAEAHYNLGNALIRLGRVPEAIKHWEQALQLNPDLAEAHYNLGLASAQAGKAEQAMGHWEQALRIKPDYAEAHYNLGVALEQTGRRQEAIEHYEQALRIKPDYAEAQSRLVRLRAVR
jgi:tetratricopeptide (TPR) repeat protein